MKVDIIALKEIYTIFIEYGSELRSIISDLLNTLFSHCVIQACLKKNYELIKKSSKIYILSKGKFYYFKTTYKHLTLFSLETDSYLFRGKLLEGFLIAPVHVLHDFFV